MLLITYYGKDQSKKEKEKEKVPERIVRIGHENES